MVEGKRAQRRRRPAHVALVDREGQSVVGGVAAGERGVVGLDLEPVKVEPGDAGGEAERRRPRAAAEVEDPLAGPRRDEGGKEYGVDGSAVAAPRLGRGGRARRGACRRSAPPRRRPRAGQPSTRPSTSLSRRTARARKASRSATISRCGRMPSEPSSTLVWTSSTKQSIPSPRRRAVLKATAVGSVVRRISAHPPQSRYTGPRGRERSGDGHERAGRQPDRAPAGEARGRHGCRQRPDPRPDGERARAAHPRGHRPSRRGRRQAPPAAAHPRRRAALRLRRRRPRQARRNRRVHPHRDAPPRRRRRRERAPARPADGQPALGQQVERARRRLSLRARRSS